MGALLCQSKGTSHIVMAFSSPVVGCLLFKKGLQEGCQRHPRTPPPPPSYAPDKILFKFSIDDFKNLSLFSLSLSGG